MKKKKFYVQDLGCFLCLTFPVLDQHVLYFSFFFFNKDFANKEGKRKRKSQYYQSSFILIPENSKRNKNYSNFLADVHMFLGIYFTPFFFFLVEFLSLGIDILVSQAQQFKLSRSACFMHSFVFIKSSKKILGRKLLFNRKFEANMIRIQ